MKQQPFLFTDSQMALFGVQTPTARRGRASDTFFMGHQSPRKSMYAVVTDTIGQYVRRAYRLPLVRLSGAPGGGKMEVAVQADAKNRRGYGFATIYINDGEGNVMVLTESAQTLRNMAQMLNAAANSTKATWRK